MDVGEHHILTSVIAYPDYILYANQTSPTTTFWNAVPAMLTIMAMNIKLLLPISGIVKPMPLNLVSKSLAT